MKHAYAVVDCDNCYVSCERVFRPDLAHKPVVVLSNNDGCVVSRSNEAKQLGVKNGTPFFRLAADFPGADIAVFSSNYELYGELTGRVMRLIRATAPNVFRYSIDEAFVELDNMSADALKQWGEALHVTVKRHVGLPVSIGIASNKTLAKMASHFAKHYRGYRHCCVIDSDEQRRKALKLVAIDEVWGIGRRYAARLSSLGIHTAYDFATHSREWLCATFRNEPLLRTWHELNGDDRVPNEKPAGKKSICVSRSLATMATDQETLRHYVSNFAARCAEKLRRQHTAATMVGVFLWTNRFRDDLPQYANYCDTTLLTPSDATIDIVKAALGALSQIWREGYAYKKVGVMVASTEAGEGVQTNLIDYDHQHYEKMKRLDAVVDRLNRHDGADTVTLASQQFSTPGRQGKALRLDDALRHDHKSPCRTTRWSDILQLKG